MKVHSYALVVGLSCLFAASVSAQDASLRFNGEILDGPLQGYKFVGSCLYDAKGDPLQQRGRCQLSARDPAGHRLQIADSNAHLAVVGDGRLVQISLGLNPVTKSAKGNNKLAAFDTIVYFDEKVTLLTPFPSFVAASISFLGVMATTSDCLIYDFLGPA